MWIALLFLSWFIGFIGSGIIFGTNDLEPSILTIAIMICPIVNFLFVMTKVIADGVKSLNGGELEKEIKSIKKLFVDDDRKK
jgi:hypothetical protein